MIRDNVIAIDKNKVIERRKELGLTQAGLARKSKVNRQTLWGIEKRNYTTITLETLNKLAGALEMSGLNLLVTKEKRKAISKDTA